LSVSQVDLAFIFTCDPTVNGMLGFTRTLPVACDERLMVGGGVQWPTINRSISNVVSLQYRVWERDYTINWVWQSLGACAHAQL